MPTAVSKILDGNFEDLINIDEIRESLRQLDEEENKIDASLDDLLSQEAQLDNSLNTLNKVGPQLDLLKINARHFTNKVNETARLAEVISDKVRQLDKEQSRAKIAIQYVEDVQELKFCIASLNQVMAKKDYDQAAGLLQRASKIDASILKGSLAEYTVPTSENPDHPEKTLTDTKATLFNIFSQQFDAAVAERNQADITRYFKLFPLINCQTEGLDQYSRFVCNIIKSRCADEISQGLVTAPTYFADALTRLFENIAVIIDQHQPLVEMHYGKGKMLRVIQRLQEEGDKQGITILDRFLQTRKLESKLVEIQCLMIAMLRNNTTTLNRASPNPSSIPNDTSNNPLVDPRQLDANLYELSLISQRTVLFNSFISERANDEMEILASDEQELVMKGKEGRFYGTNGLLISSGLTKRVKELMNSYLVIDEYLLKKNVTKAIHMDDHDSNAPHISSTCVDDVFFIFKTLLRRALAASDPEVISSTVRGLIKTIEAQYINHFAQKMSTVFTANEATGRNAIEVAKLNYMVVLNNLDVSIDYTHRLAKELQPDITNGIWFDEENDIVRVIASIDKFEGIVDKFNSLLKHGIEQLVNQILKPRMRPLYQEAYREVKYVLEEDEYNEADVEEKFIKRFRQGFSRLIQVYKRTLTENNFSTLMSLLLDIITGQWERIVFQTRFNQYGALRFDKDLRSIILYLSSITEWLPRDKFTRLNQMSIILNFEEPSEIHDLWGTNKSNPINWRLTVNEVKKMMSLRLEFESQLADHPFLKE